MRTSDTFERKLSEDPFTRIKNEIFKDKRLSLKALGLLCLCLSLDPETWTFSIRGLDAICKDGRTAIIRSLDELEALGYLRRSRIQEHKEDGGFGHTHYVFFDTPQDETAPCTQNVYTDNPYTENVPQEINQLETKKLDNPHISPVREKLPLPKEVMDRIDSYAGPDLQLRDALLHFVLNRKAINRPVKTQHAMSLLLTTLDKKSDGDRSLKLTLIREAEEKGWLTFYRHDDRRGGSSPPARPERYEPEVSAW